MKEVNFEDFKVRCSSIGKIMSNSQSNPLLTDKQAERLKELEGKDSITDKQKVELSELLVKKENATKVILSDTCIEYLMEWYSEAIADKIAVDREAMDIQYTQKGKSVEEDSIVLLSRVDKRVYNKNDNRVENDYLSGEPDIFEGDSIYTAETIIDIKSIWDYPTFLKQINKPLQPLYRQQVQGYCDITGASQGYIAKVLVNMPEEIITDYQYRLLKKMNAATTESTEFKKQWDKWYRSMIFEDIPKELRVHKTTVTPFTNEEKQKIYDRVKICRQWLSDFHNQYIKLNSPQ